MGYHQNLQNVIEDQVMTRAISFIGEHRNNSSDNVVLFLCS